MNIIALLYFMVPAYAANMAPVLAMGILKWLAVPVDFNARFMGKPLFGKHKTWRGIVVGTAAGMLVFLAQKWLFRFSFFSGNSIIDYSSAALWVGFLLAVGALAGDLVKSFFKRRVGVKPGMPWIPLDEIDYSIGAIAFASIIFFPGWAEAAAIVIASALLHIAANHFAFYTGIRKEKW